MTLIVSARLQRRGVSALGFVPAYINRNAQAEIVRASDARFSEIVACMTRISASQGLAVRYEVDADRVLVRSVES